MVLDYGSPHAARTTFGSKIIGLLISFIYHSSNTARVSSSLLSLFVYSEQVFVRIPPFSPATNLISLILNAGVAPADVSTITL